MSLISVEVRVDTDVLEAYSLAAKRAPKLFATSYRRATVGLRKQMLERLRTEPPKPSYPIAWTSDRQRRYVMAKLRSEGNLPYRRTGKLLEGYEVEIIANDNGGVLQVVNKSPVARYVVGDNAQRFHLATGWQQTAKVVSEFDQIAFDVLVDTWFTLVDPYAGVS